MKKVVVCVSECSCSNPLKVLVPDVMMENVSGLLAISKDGSWIRMITPADRTSKIAKIRGEKVKVS